MRPSGKSVPGRIGQPGSRRPVKSGFFVVLMILCLVCSAIPFPVAAGSGPTVTITDYQVNPPVLMQGEQGILTVTITNTAGTATASQSSQIGSGGGFLTSSQSTPINARIESVTVYGNGIEVISGSFRDVGEIGPGQSIRLSALIRAPEESGIFFPEIWVRVQDGTSLKYPVPVNVDTAITLLRKPALVLEKQIPGTVSPGEDFDVVIEVINRGLSRANDIMIQIGYQGTALLPVSPSTLYIDRLNLGESRQVLLRFASSKDTPIGLYPIPLTVTYESSDGTRLGQTEILGVRIQGSSDLSLATISTDPVRVNRGDPFTLIVRIENTGTADATSVTGSLDIPVSGVREAFVGKIEPDNDAPAVFFLTADRGGEIPYTLTISWEDDYGPHQYSRDLVLMVESPFPTGMVGGIIVLLIAAGFTYYWFSYRKKKAA